MFFEKIKNLFLIVHVKNWYVRYERPLSSLSLVGGFVFDAVTLKRVDMFWENFWVIVHLAVVGICIIVINTIEHEPAEVQNLSKAHFWLINILQFFFGGLLSTFLVFYFRSATLAVSWPFILILVLAFIANESFKKHYTRISFQISLFYLSLFLFSIFLVPVITHSIGPSIFLLSGVVSLAVMAVFLLLLKYFSKEEKQENMKLGVLSTLIIFVTIHILYFTHLIPPIPLSLKDAGIYHGIQKDGTGNYIVASEIAGWQNYFHWYEDFHVSPGSSAYAYSAIFSPTSFNITVVHVWQYYSETNKKWVTQNTITLPVVGGRDGGYRTYSIKSNLIPGRYRVNVETTAGDVIGRIGFTVVQSDTEPSLTFETK